MAPPEAMILIWSTSWRRFSRAALRTSSAPSAITPAMPTQQSTGSIHSERRRLSAWPPVCESGRPETSMRGPG